jgi:hypothetical protein
MKQRFVCIGGPFDGACIWLQNGATGTLVFTLNGQRGFYERAKDSYFYEAPREVFWKEVQDDMCKKEG